VIHNYLEPKWLEISREVRIDQDPLRIAAIKAICEDIVADWTKYQIVTGVTGVPPELLAAIHYRESSRNFKTMLHNGEPLNRKSTIVPIGVGPFASWEASAVDVMKRQGATHYNNWSMDNCLKFAEAFNGKGYRKRGMYSPYVFSFTNMSNELGGYASDGKYTSKYPNTRPGVAAIILGLKGLYGT
jgi:lysozyme family protein